MKGLLLKDFYMMKKYCRSFLLILLVFTAISLFSESGEIFIVYPVLIASMLPVTLISYDERSRWNVYSDTMPYSRAIQVSDKYLIVLMAVGSCMAVMTAAQIGKAWYLHDPLDPLALVTTLLAVGLLVPSVTLPIVFKWGVEKGRMMYYVLVVLLFAGFALVNLWNSDEEPAVVSGILFNGWMLLGGALILFALSWWLSIRFYQKREW